MTKEIYVEDLPETTWRAIMSEGRPRSAYVYTVVHYVIVLKTKVFKFDVELRMSAEKRPNEDEYYVENCTFGGYQVMDAKELLSFLNENGAVEIYVNTFTKLKE